MIPHKVLGIMQSLVDNGHEAYIVGGAIRDCMMCVKPVDWDVFTDATGDDILTIFPHWEGYWQDERRTKILTVIVDGVEVSQYHANGVRTETGMSLEQHLSTCDFTINSMAMGIDRKIIDNYCGMAHLRSKEVCCVGDPKDRIEEDKLRALRAIRFSVKHGFCIEKELYGAILDTDISSLPVERVREEILKTIVYHGALSMLSQSSLTSKIIPEFDRSFLHVGGGHHDETVDVHMFNAQNIACHLTDNPILVFACAFHDIGKPFVYEYREDGKVSFHDHEKVGAEIIRDVMLRMKFSGADINFVETLVSEHMFGYNNDVSDKTFVRHFKRLEDAGISIEEYMIMQYSDYQANMKNKRVKFGDYVGQSDIYKQYCRLKFSKTPFRVSDLAISGKDLLDAGIPAGIRIGNILREVFDEVINGNIKNERNVLMYHIKHLPE